MAAHRKVTVGWVFKAAAFNVFDKIPFGENIYYAFQRNITRTLPRTMSPTKSTGSAQIAHAKEILGRRDDVETLTLLEIGAGWDLFANLIYYCYGINNQIAVDIRRWVRAETVNAAIKHLQSDPPLDCVRVPTKLVGDKNLDSDLLENYGISYRAPFDASETDLSTGSIDVITTTSVFEHLPETVCSAIIAEYRRVIAPDGMMRHTIDYSDHYAHADPSITSYNYLRFNRSVWTFLNPGIHYQNRLQTQDFVRLFEQGGFAISDLVEWKGKNSEFERVKVHSAFSQYPPETLRILGGHFLLAPA